MRISTSMMYSMPLASMQRMQSSVASLQQKIASGQRITVPSDDPVGAAQAIEVSGRLAVLDNHASAQAAGLSKLTETSSALTSLTDQLATLADLGRQAGNAALSSADRKALAQQAGATLESMRATLNSQGADGTYLFSGFRGATEPFVASGTGFAYQGDQGVQRLAITDSQELAVSVPGSEFMDATGSVLDAATQLQTALSSGAGLSAAMDSLNHWADKVSLVQTRVGASMASIQQTQEATQATRGQYVAHLSALQDLDYTSAISSLMQQQTALQASQLAFAQLHKSSLFDYLP